MFAKIIGFFTIIKNDTGYCSVRLLIISKLHVTYYLQLEKS